jgi:hypothetical protein
MQIHEITLHDSEPLKEGLLDQWSARFGAASKDPAMAAMTPAQRVKAIQNDAALEKISKAAWDNWVAKWYQIGAAKKGQVDQALFQDELRDYVQNNLLNRYQDYNALTVKNDLEQNMRAVASYYMRGDPASAKQYFDRLVDLSATARVQQPQASPNQPAAKNTQQPAAAPANLSQATAAVQQMLDRTGVSQTQAGIIAKGLTALNANQPLVAGSTRNPIADAVLKYFGFRV